jgi:hypothetical protein
MAKKVYFAFHYQDVIDFRANVVRNHNGLTSAQEAGYFDGSIWETAKKTSDLALKRMINSELIGTSVTAVLVGSETHARRWVRYEIMKSLEKGNSLLAIHINGIPKKDKLTKSLGSNPFGSLGLVIGNDGVTARPTEWNGKEWVYYSGLSSFQVAKQPAAKIGKNLPLTTWLPIYDWAAGDGYKNFQTWIS